MSTDQHLLQAIVADPEDDTARLAFADQLDELGGEANAARAEFIRLQVGLYRAGAETPDTRAARRRAADLLERYRTAWGFPTGLLRTRCAIRRGFVDELATDQWAPAPTPTDVLGLLPLHPVTRVRLGFRDGGMEVFEALQALDVPAFRKVRHLELVTEYWTDELVERLLLLEDFPELRSLALTGTAVTPASVVEVARCPRLAGLRQLRIGFAGYWLSPPRHAERGVRDEGAAAIATSPVLTGLRELSLRASGIGSAGALALADSPNLVEIEQFILTENPDIDPDTRAVLRERFGDRVFQ